MTPLRKKLDELIEREAKDFAQFNAAESTFKAGAYLLADDFVKMYEALIKIKKLDTDDTFKDRVFGCGLIAHETITEINKKLGIE